MDKKLNNICGLILLRSKSKSIKNKNIKLINNKPLFYYSAKAASKSKILDKLFIMTDSKSYKNKIKNFNLKKTEVLDRRNINASDTASSEDAISEFFKKNNFKYVMLIQATNPQIINKDIDNAIKLFFDKKYDSMLSVVKMHKFFWTNFQNKPLSVNYNYKKRQLRQKINKSTYIENGAFYIFSKNGFIKNKNRLFGKIGFFEMDKKTIFEIDDNEDFIIVENLLKFRS